MHARGLLVVFLAIPCFGQAAVSQNADRDVRSVKISYVRCGLCSMASRSGLSGTP